jgi:N-acylglucosamine-6-phosphate 2-epimerase
MNGRADDPADFFDGIRGGIVVSCQAGDGHPLRDSATIALLARCGELGGAAGLRVNGVDDLRAVREATALPVLGIEKVTRSGGLRPLITTTVAACAGLEAAGAGAIALEVADDPERGVDAGLNLLRVAARSIRVPLVADVASVDAARRAVEAGADAVATTLAGYTPSTRAVTLPDLDLVAALADLGVPVIAEGGFARPEDVAEAFRRGAWAVVIGSAITDPISITSRFVQAAGGSAEPALLRSAD